MTERVVDVDECRARMQELGDRLEHHRDGLRTMLADLLAPLTDKIGALERQVAQQNGRVSRLERWVWVCTGGGVVILWVIEHFILKRPA